LDVPITIPLGLHIGNVKLQSAEIAAMVHFLSPTDQDLQLYEDIQPQLTDPVQFDETDDASISTHPSMPDLESMTSENEDDVNPSPLPRFPDWFRRAVQNPPNVSRESAESLEFEDEAELKKMQGAQPFSTEKYGRNVHLFTKRTFSRSKTPQKRTKIPTFQKRKMTNSPKNYSNHCKSTSNYSKRHIHLQENLNRRVIQIPSNKQSESLYTLEAPTELTEDHWISSLKLPTISQQQLQKLIQPILGKELTLIQKQKLQTFLLK